MASESEKIARLTAELAELRLQNRSYACETPMLTERLQSQVLLGIVTPSPLPFRDALKAWTWPKLPANASKFFRSLRKMA